MSGVVRVEHAFIKASTFPVLQSFDTVEADDKKYMFSIPESLKSYMISSLPNSHGSNTLKVS